MATTQFEVRGAWKADGKDGTMIVDAMNQRAAEYIASARGLIVESASPLALAAQPVSVISNTRSKSALVVGAVLMVAGGVAVLTGLRFAGGSYSQQDTGRWLLLLGLPAFVAGLVVYLAARFHAWCRA